MSSNFKKGDKVTQVHPAPIEGEVTGYGLCQETGEVHAKVEWTDADGHKHGRFFKQSEIKAAE